MPEQRVSGDWCDANSNSDVAYEPAKPLSPPAQDFRIWLCHSDARQVSDLPGGELFFLSGSPTWS